MKLLRFKTDGFTVSELVVTITVAVIMSGVLLTVTFRYFTNAIQSQETANLAVESQTLLSQLVEDLRLSTGVGAVNTLADANAPSGGWQTSDDTDVLIITSPVTDQARNIVYEPDTGFPYENEYIYFKSGKTMYKRTLRNTDASGNTAVTTCPPGAATTACPEDRVFSDNLDDISFEFFDTNNTLTTDPLLAKSVKITLHVSKKVFGKTIALTNTTQVTQRNL